MPKTKKAGLLTKLVILALLIYLATSLLNLQSRIRQTQAERDALSRQVAEQTQVNADLAEDVANPDDPDRIADIARDKLGLVVPGEKVIVITN
ncbi:cell division protein FtsL [Intestinimonas aquisgranensis]|uniref:cell division protein FtsL n=1 Tax=Intestinimonas timonensis TaxID=1689270 RepID=UPI001D0EDB68|nr:cell division protein FtsL [Intestinimonas timonensis]MCC2259429.1 cell division protein FtsL [Intestinimonas aquisgranensis]